MNNIAATPASKPETTNGNNSQTTESNRAIWIYTGYAGAGLALLGVLAYHFSAYVLR